VYVSTVGGIALREPAADLAIALAIASAYKDQPVDSHVAAVGEISLAGEIRQVTSNSQRKSEAKRLGMSEFIDTEAGNIRQALQKGLGKPRSEAAPF
jgi:DNA repair protein RadA/Sms